MKAILIPIEGDMTIVEVDGYEQMTATIGGAYGERVRVAIDRAILVDGTGRITGKSVNRRASILYGIERHGEPICGDALYMGEGMVDSGEGYPEIDFIPIPDIEAELVVLNRDLS